MKYQQNICPFCHSIIMVAWLNFCQTWARFVSLVRSKLRLCSANHRPGYWSNLRCDWPSTARAYFEQETENGPWCTMCFLRVFMMLPALHSVWKIAQVSNWTNLVSSGACLNIKTVFPMYGDSHGMDRTVVRPSYNSSCKADMIYSYANVYVF